ncbi:MAG: hypothetical protein V1792_25795 [Pseudomonadota bacterium]
MIDMAKMIALLAVLAVAVASPADAGPRSSDSTTYKIYSGGVSALETTEGLISSVLKGSFSLFNPCLDIVKGCTNIVLAPIEYPLSYLDRPARRVATKTLKVPVPEKPELPKK